MSITRLCSLFGVTRPTMRKWLERAGVSIDERNPVDTGEKKSTVWLEQFKRPAVRDRALAVVEEVRRELAQAKEHSALVLSSNERLGKVYGVSPASIYQYLRAGLTGAERAIREANLRAAAYNDVSAAKSREVSVLRVVRAEIEDHKAGRRAKLRTANELAEHAGLSVPTLNRHLQKLPFSEKVYREKALNAQKADSSVRGALIAAAVSEVQEKVGQGATAPTRPVRTVQELAAAMGVSEAYAGRILRETDLPELKERVATVYQQTARKNVTKETILRRNQVVAFVKEEIELHRKGHVARLSHTDALRERFGVSQNYLRYNLVDKERGQLTEDECSYRRSVLAKQTSEQTFVEHGHPFSRITPEKRAKMMEALRKRRNVQTLGTYFDSDEEAVCAESLARYVPGWKPDPGISYQVRAGSYAFDFRIGSKLIEHHPILLFWSESGLGDFASAKEFDKFRDVESRLVSREDRLVWRARVTDMLGARYLRNRQELADSHRETSGSIVVWTRDAGDFYDKVLSVHAPALPRERFIREFAKRKRELVFARKRELAEEGTLSTP